MSNLFHSVKDASKRNISQETNRNSHRLTESIHEAGATLPGQTVYTPQILDWPSALCLSQFIIASMRCCACTAGGWVPLVLQLWRSSEAYSTLGGLLILLCSSSGHGKGSCGERPPQIDPLNMEGFSREEMHDWILGPLHQTAPLEAEQENRGEAERLATLSVCECLCVHIRNIRACARQTTTLWACSSDVYFCFAHIFSVKSAAAFEFYLTEHKNSLYTEK